MKQLISIRIVMLFVIFYNMVILSSDNNIGIIDLFVLKQEIMPRIKDISFKYENHFSNEEQPIYVTINSRLHKVDMPTTTKPFIIINHDAQNIIDDNPDIFDGDNIKNKIAFVSQNQSNRVIHGKLAEYIIPIDHCTHIKINDSSIDIVSLFFDTSILSACISRLKLSIQKQSLNSVKQKRRREFLSIPRAQSDSLQFNYEKHITDQSITHRANMAYYSAEDENSDIVHVSVLDYDFWKNS